MISKAHVIVIVIRAFINNQCLSNVYLQLRAHPLFQRLGTPLATSHLWFLSIASLVSGVTGWSVG